MASSSAFALRKPSVIPGFGLTLGFSLVYLSLIVLVALEWMRRHNARLRGLDG